MVEKSYSATEPSPVSVEHIGDHTTVWLRKNIRKDTADFGPDDAESVTYWSCDEVCFSTPGVMSEGEASERFVELWSEHSGENWVDETMSQLRALARVQVSTMDLTNATSTECVGFRNYWPEWAPDTKYAYQQPLQHKGLYYRASKALTSSATYPPDTAGESEYYPITVAPDGIIVYRECHGEYDMVRKGERRHYPDSEGPVYEALEDTAYSPDAYPGHWTLVSEEAS